MLIVRPFVKMTAEGKMREKKRVTGEKSLTTVKIMKQLNYMIPLTRPTVFFLLDLLLHLMSSGKYLERICHLLLNYYLVKDASNARKSSINCAIQMPTIIGELNHR